MGHRRFDYDVLVIGAGGAGLRAAIEAAERRRHGRRSSASRCSARRTPSWPRAAWPRRWPTSTTATTGRCTSPTRCAAASTSTTGAWPSCTPGGARARARARGVGRGVRPHARRPHPPAQLRRPSLSAPRARRRPHRARDDPHAAGSRRPPRRHRPHGVHGHRAAARTATASPAPSAYDRERGRFHALPRQGGHPRDRRHRPRVQDHQQQLGGHRRRPRARLSRRRRAHRHGVHPVPSDRDGLAAERAGASSSPRACAAKAASCATARAAASCSTTSRTTTSSQTAADEEEGWRYTQGDKSARRPPELLTRDHVARCINREVQGEGAAARTAACSSTSPGSRRSSRTRRSTSSGSCRACTTSSRSSPTSTSRRSRWRSGPTTHYIMGGIRVDADTQMSTVPGLFAAGRVRGGHQRRQSPGRQLAVGPDRVRQARRRVRRRVHPRRESAAAARSTTRRSRPRRRDGARAVRRGATARTPTRSSSDLQEMMQDLVGIVRTESEMQQALEAIGGAAGARRARRRRPATASTTPAGTPRSTCRTCSTVSEAITRSAIERTREPRRSLPRGLSRTRTRSSASSTSCVQRGSDGAMQLSHATRSARCRPS